MAQAHPSHITIEKITTSSAMSTILQPDLQCCKNAPGTATHHRKPSINRHARMARSDLSIRNATMLAAAG
jgi:hypothetical protein